MKVYTHVVIDMRTFEDIELECFDYEGPITECKGGGSGGGGGGTGQVSYPAYMQTIHETWLNDVDGYMDAAIGNSPYTTAVAYDPDDALDAMDTAIVAFNTVVDAISAASDYASYSDAVVAQVDSNVISTTLVDAMIAAHAAKIDSDYDDQVTKFTSGMRDIGAAMTSSFVFGQADIYAKKERELSEFGARLYIEVERQRNEMIATGIKDVFQAHFQRVQFEGDVARLTGEAKRVRVVAKGEETRENYEYDEMDAKWDMEMTHYGAAMLASIGGGIAASDSGKMSKTQSALSGMFAGAAAGAAIPGAGAWGAGIGAAIGLAGGLFG